MFDSSGTSLLLDDTDIAETARPKRVWDRPRKFAPVAANGIAL
jgi:hypothetical protein